MQHCPCKKGVFGFFENVLKEDVRIETRYVPGELGLDTLSDLCEIAGPEFDPNY